LSEKEVAGRSFYGERKLSSKPVRVATPVEKGNFKKKPKEEREISPVKR